MKLGAFGFVRGEGTYACSANCCITLGITFPGWVILGYFPLATVQACPGKSVSNTLRNNGG